MIGSKEKKLLDRLKFLLPLFVGGVLMTGCQTVATPKVTDSMAVTPNESVTAGKPVVASNNGPVAVSSGSAIEELKRAFASNISVGVGMEIASSSPSAYSPPPDYSARTFTGGGSRGVPQSFDGGGNYRTFQSQSSYHQNSYQTAYHQFYSPSSSYAYQYQQYQPNIPYGMQTSQTGISNHQYHQYQQASSPYYPSYYGQGYSYGREFRSYGGEWGNDAVRKYSSRKKRVVSDDDWTYADESRRVRSQRSYQDRSEKKRYHDDYGAYRGIVVKPCETLKCALLKAKVEVSFLDDESAGYPAKELSVAAVSLDDLAEKLQNLTGFFVVNRGNHLVISALATTSYPVGGLERLIDDRITSLLHHPKARAELANGVLTVTDDRAGIHNVENFIRSLMSFARLSYGIEYVKVDTKTKQEQVLLRARVSPAMSPISVATYQVGVTPVANGAMVMVSIRDKNGMSPPVDTVVDISSGGGQTPMQFTINGQQLQFIVRAVKL